MFEYRQLLKTEVCVWEKSFEMWNSFVFLPFWRHKNAEVHYFLGLLHISEVVFACWHTLRILLPAFIAGKNQTLVDLTQITLRACNCINYFSVSLWTSLISDIKITAKYTYFTVSTSGCMLYQTPSPQKKNQSKSAEQQYLSFPT